MVDKGQGHSFWYKIDFSYTTFYRLSISSNFCSRTHRLATIHLVQTTDRQTDRQTDNGRNTVA